MSRTRIIILQVKELIYTAIFAGLGILLLILLFFMFWPGRDKDTAPTSATSSTVADTSAEDAADNQSQMTASNAVDDNADAKYKAGVYTSELSLGDSAINLQVTLDTNRVKSVELVNLEDSVATMYPLIKPAVKDIAEQLAQNVSPEEVVLSEDSQYTQQMILDTISGILEEASEKAE